MNAACLLDDDGEVIDLDYTLEDEILRKEEEEESAPERGGK